ncbi:MAG TPA: hypothetical protein VLG08_09965 [Casimicrobiaceae bacterium]|jgi:hypothetical protein|nr:hypothetical protein [Casimicrobiaceae bacterium]
MTNVSRTVPALNDGLVVGARDPKGREESRLYLGSAIEVPGKA